MTWRGRGVCDASDRDDDASEFSVADGVIVINVVAGDIDFVVGGCQWMLAVYFGCELANGGYI